MPKFQTSDGLQLYYEDTTGDKGAILCLTGLTRNLRDFDYVKPYLEGYRVVTMDYRGRGLSDRDPEYLNYNVLRETRDVNELLDHLGIEYCMVIGTSRGGLLAMVMAAQEPRRPCGVVLNDVGPILGAVGLARIMAYVGRRPEAATYAEWVTQLKTELAEEFQDIPEERWFHEAQNRFVETETGLDLRYDPRLFNSLIEQSASNSLPDFELYFDQLKDMPTGVIRGANSAVLTEEGLAVMHDRHQGLVSKEVPKRGHTPFLDEPESLDVIHAILKACLP